MASQLFLQRTVTYQLGLDSGMTKLRANFPRSAITDSTTYTKEVGASIALASPTTDYVVPMGQVTTGKILYIESDQDITVRWDVAVTGDKRVLRAPNGLGQMLATIDFTALYITNASGSVANVAIAIAGV